MLIKLNALFLFNFVSTPLTLTARFSKIKSDLKLRYIYTRVSENQF